MRGRPGQAGGGNIGQVIGLLFSSVEQKLRGKRVILVRVLLCASLVGTLLDPLISNYIQDHPALVNLASVKIVSMSPIPSILNSHLHKTRILSLSSPSLTG